MQTTYSITFYTCCAMHNILFLLVIPTFLYLFCWFQTKHCLLEQYQHKPIAISPTTLLSFHYIHIHYHPIINLCSFQPLKCISFHFLYLFNKVNISISSKCKPEKTEISWAFYSKHFIRYFVVCYCLKTFEIDIIILRVSMYNEMCGHVCMPVHI